MAFGQKTLHQQMEGHKIYEANVWAIIKSLKISSADLKTQKVRADIKKHSYELLKIII